MNLGFNVAQHKLLHGNKLIKPQLIAIFIITFSIMALVAKLILMFIMRGVIHVNFMGKLCFFVVNFMFWDH